MIRAAADFCKEAAQSLPLCDLFVYLVIVSGVISFGGRLARLKTGRLSNRRLTFVNLPKYAPQTNPIERIWWHLHETITRNHRHQSLQELLNEIYTWAETQHTFFTQTASFHKTYRIPA